MKKEGYFGNFGGRFVPEALRPPLMELEEAMDSIYRCGNLFFFTEELSGYEGADFYW